MVAVIPLRNIIKKVDVEEVPEPTDEDLLEIDKTEDNLDDWCKITCNRCGNNFDMRDAKSLNGDLVCPRCKHIIIL